VLDGAVNASGAVTLRILLDGRKVGGAVVTINEESIATRSTCFS